MNATTHQADHPSVSPRKTAPGPRGNPVLGSVRPFFRDSLGFMTRMAREYGDVAHYRLVHWQWYQVNHPDGIQHVLQENNRNYSKGEMTTSIMQPLLGNGLLLSEGDFWLRQRRLMQPTFHRKSIAAFGQLMIDATQRMLTGWERSADRGTPLDIADEMMRMTLDVVTEALFSTRLDADSAQLRADLTTLLDDIGRRFETPLYPPPGVPTAHNRRRNVALRRLDRAMNRIIEERRQRPGERHDLLALLMETRDADTGEGMSDQQLRDEVVTLFGAGQETSAVALSWTWYLLAQHPQVEQRLHAELAAVLNGRTPTIEDLAQLPYTGMVLDEAMRLYPPAWATNRQVIADDAICGYRVPAGAYVIISPYVMHRHPAYWDEPERFDPERFAPERAASRPHFAYFPFGGGPRLCIGKTFALIEMKLALATIAQRYTLRLPPGQTVEPYPMTTLRPRDGLPMIVKER